MADVTAIDITAELTQDSIPMQGSFVCTPPGN